MERLFAAGIALATLLVMPAFLAAPAPAGACSLHCPGDAQELSEVRVTLIAGDKEAVAPEWPEDGRMNVTFGGRPESLSVEGFTVNIYDEEVD